MYAQNAVFKCSCDVALITHGNTKQGYAYVIAVRRRFDRWNIANLTVNKHILILMVRAYDKPHVLGRLTAYIKGEATWNLLSWTKQARLLSPLTRHYAVTVIDTAGSGIERIDVKIHIDV